MPDLYQENKQEDTSSPIAIRFYRGTGLHTRGIRAQKISSSACELQADEMAQIHHLKTLPTKLQVNFG